MVKDYAKKRRPTKKKQKKMTLSSVILLLLILGAVIGFSYWFWGGKSSLPPAVTAKPAQKILPRKAKAESVEYQFYTLLPKMKVETAEKSQDVVSTGYWLQMAVYYAEKDAASMIERLQLQGLMPQMVQRPSETSKKMLYVVVLGPYATKPEAIKAQQTLLKQGFNNMIFYIPAQSKTDNA